MTKQSSTRLYDRLLTKQEVAEFITCLDRVIPEPQTELAFSNPYTLLVATLLSAQATDVQVNKATKKLFEIVSTPYQMLELGIETLITHIRTIGLFNSKAVNVMKGAQILVDRYGGVVPEDRDILETLPGVGRKTANVVMNVAFGHPTVAVDTHIFRVGNRTGLAPGKDPLAVELNLLKRLPKDSLMKAHHLLILHGRYHCKARKPLCSTCPVQQVCRFKEKAIN